MVVLCEDATGDMLLSAAGAGASAIAALEVLVGQSRCGGAGALYSV